MKSSEEYINSNMLGECSVKWFSVNIKYWGSPERRHHWTISWSIRKPHSKAFIVYLKFHTFLHKEKKTCITCPKEILWEENRISASFWPYMHGKPPGTTVDLFISLLKMLFGLVLQKEDKMPKKRYPCPEGWLKPYRHDGKCVSLEGKHRKCCRYSIQDIKTLC